ncbi:MAG: hypothetical protein R3190_15185, partial [Thermoanaerobaculia bacterium]|nr:hypothetical protein [Thermoanaerobaculia bacterium]
MAQKTRIRRALTWWLLACASAVGGGAGAAEPGEQVHALLLNGGGRPAINYQSHLHHLEELVDELEERGIPSERIHVFSADGEDPGADLAVRDSLPEGFWRLEGTRLG